MASSTVFNRSHYEDVLIVRVHDLVPEDVWRRRYEHIRAFERMLDRHRDDDREGDAAHLAGGAAGAAAVPARRPAKRWKFNPADLDERKRWDDYMAAYADALRRDVDRRRRPGTASPPTASGTATGRCCRS